MINFLRAIGYNNLVNIFICFISLFGGFFFSRITSKKSNKNDVYKKRLDNVYAPLFQKIEPNIYQKLDESTLKEYINFFDNFKYKYYELIDPNTLIEFNTLKKNFLKNNACSYKNFSRFCYYIDKNFENLRRKLGLPRRNFFYKWEYRQYPKNKQILIERLLILALILIVILFLGSFIFSIIYLLSNLITSLIFHFPKI